MAGQWGKTKTPGVYVQDGPRGRKYKAAFRDRRGVVTSRTFPLERLAKDYLADIRIKRAQNSLPDVSKARRTMTELWDHFAKTYRGKPSTFASYEARWTKHIEPRFGRRQLRKLDSDEIEQFYTDLEDRTSLDTRRKVQQVVHKMLAGAVAKKWLTHNPADGIEMPKAMVQRDPRPLTEEEVEKLAKQIPPRNSALVWMLVETGARPGEITALKMKNLTGRCGSQRPRRRFGGRRSPAVPGPREASGRSQSHPGFGRP